MILQVVCPHCQGEAARMPVISEVSFLDFFLCGQCGKISEHVKSAAGQVSSTVAPAKLLAFDVRTRQTI